MSKGILAIRVLHSQQISTNFYFILNWGSTQKIVIQRSLQFIPIFILGVHELSGKKVTFCMDS